MNQGPVVSGQWSVGSTGTAGITRIEDHRAIYLTYEGPISGNRGEVKRVAGGEAILLYQSSAALHLRLATDPPCEIILPLAPQDD
jgi:hypothetical protein